MTDPAVCYTCVTNGYDAVAPVPSDWSTRFILFHDGSIDVPVGWEGVKLSIPGVTGVDLNRYAKMLPHRLDLPSDRSMYVDGNIFFRQDPGQRIETVLSQHRFAAMVHPAMDCAYDDIRRTLQLGFVWPFPARRAVRFLRDSGVTAHAGLFECNILYRRHDDSGVTELGEAWWAAWQMGYRRDQALLIAAAHRVGLMPAPLGRNDVHDADNPLMGLRKHSTARPRGERAPRRLASEALLFRQWTRP